MDENKESIRLLVEEAIKNHKIDFLVTLMAKFQSEYIDIAKLATEDQYQISWTHKQVLDFITYEM
jgi:hypothetical protein